MTRTRQVVLASTLIVAGLAVPPLFAQARGGGRGGGPVYDLKTEATFKGTVDSIERIAAPEGGGGGRGRGRRGLGGTHIALKTDAGVIEVHLGPTAFLEEKKVEITAGDALDVVGSRVTLDGESFVVARELKKGDRSWTLRDASGRPLWSGGAR